MKFSTFLAPGVTFINISTCMHVFPGVWVCLCFYYFFFPLIGSVVIHIYMHFIYTCVFKCRYTPSAWSHVVKPLLLFRIHFLSLSGLILSECRWGQQSPKGLWPALPLLHQAGPRGETGSHEEVGGKQCKGWNCKSVAQIQGEE